MEIMFDIYIYMSISNVYVYIYISIHIFMTHNVHIYTYPLKLFVISIYCNIDSFIHISDIHKNHTSIKSLY